MGWTLLICPSGLLFDVVGSAYPLYGTLRMLAVGTTQQDAPKWITYWCLLSFIRFLTGLLDFILSMIPFHSYLVIALLIYLQSPFTEGSTVILTKVLEPKVFPLLRGKEVK